MNPKKLHILVIGAHPDDCDIKAGGVAILYSQLGHKVRFISSTNGNAGHHKESSDNLAKRRKKETQEAAQIAGIEYLVLEHPDGELLANLENRKQFIRLIREFRPDLILTHRANDYHPDHRYTSILVQDSADMVTLPLVCAETKNMDFKPVIGYFSDRFKKPVPFEPTVAINIDLVYSKKIDMLICHRSQFFEWLAYNRGYESDLPNSDAEGRIYLEKIWKDWLIADPWRDVLRKYYAKNIADKIQFAEAFEISEYGAPVTAESLRILFPFFD